MNEAYVWVLPTTPRHMLLLHLLLVLVVDVILGGLLQQLH